MFGFSPLKKWLNKQESSSISPETAAAGNPNPNPNPNPRSPNPNPNPNQHNPNPNPRSPNPNPAGNPNPNPNGPSISTSTNGLSSNSSSSINVAVSSINAAGSSFLSLSTHVQPAANTPSYSNASNMMDLDYSAGNIASSSGSISPDFGLNSPINNNNNHSDNEYSYALLVQNAASKSHVDSAFGNDDILRIGTI